MAQILKAFHLDFQIIDFTGIQAVRESPSVSTEQPCEKSLESPGLKREWTNLKENNDDSERRKPIRFPSAPSSIFPTTLSNDNIQKTRETVAGGVPTVLSLLPFSQANAQTPDMNPWLFTTANGTMAYFSPLPSGNGNFQSTLREYQTLPIRYVSVSMTMRLPAFKGPTGQRFLSIHLQVLR